MDRRIEQLLVQWPHVDQTTLLYDVLLTYTSEHVSPENDNYLNTICTHMIPCLVTFIKHAHQGLFYVEKKFDATPLNRPAFTHADRDAIVHVLRGTHREAVRHLFAAVTAGVTEAELVKCLRTINVPVPPEIDRYAEDVSPDVRGREINTFLAFRRDLPPRAQMLMLWDICADMQQKHEQQNYLQRICNECINPFLISCVAQLPDAVAILKRCAFEKYGSSLQHEPPPQGVTWQEVLAHFDANHDGTISQPEAIKALANPQYKQDAIRIGFEPGTFTQESDGRKKFTHTFQEIDKDGDKAIDALELQMRFLTYTPRNS
jgi:hypothetical protein